MLYRLRPCRLRRLPLLLSKPFTSTSAALISDDTPPVTTETPISNPSDTIRDILHKLRKFGLNQFVTGGYFHGTFASKLDSDTVDQIIDKLSVESPESAVGFYSLLKSDYGFQPSTKCVFVVAHILAEMRRVWDLQDVIKEIVAQEGQHFRVIRYFWIV